MLVMTKMKRGYQGFWGEILIFLGHMCICCVRRTKQKLTIEPANGLTYSRGTDELGGWHDKAAEPIKILARSNGKVGG